MNSTSDQCLSRDAIERFLDRSWMLERISSQALKSHRSALEVLDDWLQENRVATLSTATPSDVRALLKSTHWDKVSRGCEALLGLVTRFYQSLCASHFRGDDPMETLIHQELAAAARKRDKRPARSQRMRKLSFSQPRVV